MFSKQQRSRVIDTVLRQPFNIRQDHFWGPPDAPLEVIVYSDFQCEHCGDFYTSIKLLRRHFGNELKFVFRHYPFPSIYPLSLDAALASESAALHGMFWEMHDRIFENQRYLVRSSFERFAREIGLNDNSIINIIGYKKLLQRVLDDFKTGLKNGATGTPTLFINGRLYNGLLDIESLREIFQYSLDMKKGKV
jgi:protein-disulfide isomerase